MKPDWRRPATIGAVLVAVGCAIRVNNALRYPTLWGYDAKGNWEYVRRLSHSWALPEPDAGWSTSHPPLFYYLCAALSRLANALDLDFAVVLVRFASTAAGLAIVWLAVQLVRRADPENARRRLLAAALLLFLPGHVMISAMVNEELVAALFTSLAVVGVARALEGGARDSAARAAGVGAAAGLSLLTKLSGAVALATALGTYAAAGWRGGRGRAAGVRIGLVVLVASLAGGWFYARTWVRHGYVYPHALPVHEVMFSMPPGERRPYDYVNLPLATFRDPQVLNPALLRSVWGSTHATLWFDGHRFFLPAKSDEVRRLGTLILVLALLPSVAFGVGLLRGLRRAVLSPRGPDLPLLLLVAFTLAGYVLFTWRNPWFATLKGTYLLGLCVPFAFYASEVLADWTRGRGVRAAALWLALGLLAASVTLGFSYGLVFDKREAPGLVWQATGR
ncbi:MAG: glycosyltransferase family 39 protein [Deltaproteobacteria bacterium]|nr:MAG: glycosyltransferase family 39 protein [Deltaproteobacteria bacterium]